jgi:hypothetical protein
MIANLTSLSTPGLLGSLPLTPSANLNGFGGGFGSVGSLTSFMPGFNGIPVLPGVAQQPSSSLPAFDYSGLNQLNNSNIFYNMPYVRQVPLQGFYSLGDGQRVSNTQYTAYIPSVVPGSITNTQQLANLPNTSGSLAAVLQLAGIPPSVIGSSALNNSGSLIPPIFGLKA